MAYPVTINDVDLRVLFPWAEFEVVENPADRFSTTVGRTWPELQYTTEFIADPAYTRSWQMTYVPKERYPLWNICTPRSQLDEFNAQPSIIFRAWVGDDPTDAFRDFRPAIDRRMPWGVSIGWQIYSE